MAKGNNKTAKAADLRQQSDDQLQAQLLHLSREQFNLRFQAATGQLANAARKRTVRRDIAKIQTVLNERARPAKAAAGKRG